MRLKSLFILILHYTVVVFLMVFGDDYFYDHGKETIEAEVVTRRRNHGLIQQHIHKNTEINTSVASSSTSASAHDNHDDDHGSIDISTAGAGSRSNSDIYDSPPIVGHVSRILKVGHNRGKPPSSPNSRKPRTPVFGTSSPTPEVTSHIASIDDEYNNTEVPTPSPTINDEPTTTPTENPTSYPTITTNITTGSPTSTDSSCLTDSGSYGITLDDDGSTNPFIISFRYQVELSSSNSAEEMVLIDDVLPPLEKAFNDYLLPAVFSANCGTLAVDGDVDHINDEATLGADGGSRRDRDLIVVQDEKSNSRPPLDGYDQHHSRRRRLAIVGISARPNDEQVPTIGCVGETESEQNVCTLVDGKLTLYTDDGDEQGDGDEERRARRGLDSVDNDDDNDAAASTIQGTLRQGMEEDAFVDAHESIVRVTYINTDATDDETNSNENNSSNDHDNNAQTQQGNDTDEEDDDGLNRVVIGGALAAAGAVMTLVFLFVGYYDQLSRQRQRRRRQQRQQQRQFSQGGGSPKRQHVLMKDDGHSWFDDDETTTAAPIIATTSSDTRKSATASV